ncbi:YusW family protein [Edaphobacillus lindanitolerans]|uniref:YusW-like protein n=1 Tax=Edaphobacillus lindanitolerans TaxID=550447 RepID=A0A1U7PHX6_9BACI|nr:YusW family protein [Edaphobacillus lindanitolerans]SIT70346.1 YusW-like protein [Edaphobacillus lindanitolerans]
MKFRLLGLTLLSGTLVLGACGDKNNTENDNSSATTENTGNTTEEAPDNSAAGDNPAGGKGHDGYEETQQGYGFKVFDLEIDVDGQDAIDADYKTEEDGTFEADYKNTIQGVDYDNDRNQKEAIDELDKLFKDILLDQQMSEEKVKKNVLRALDVQDYSKFDLEVEFDDGKKMKIEENK